MQAWECECVCACMYVCMCVCVCGFVRTCTYVCMLRLHVSCLCVNLSNVFDLIRVVVIATFVYWSIVFFSSYNLKERYAWDYRSLVGYYAHVPTAALSRVLGCTRGFVRYWKRKSLEPNFKSGKHGGARNFRIKDPELRALHDLLIYTVYQEDTQRTTDEIRRELAKKVPGEPHHACTCAVLTLRA